MYRVQHFPSILYSSCHFGFGIQYSIGVFHRSLCHLLDSKRCCWSRNMKLARFRTRGTKTSEKWRNRIREADSAAATFLTSLALPTSWCTSIEQPRASICCKYALQAWEHHPVIKMKHCGSPYSIGNALRAIYIDTLPIRASTLAQRRAFHEYFVTHLPSSSLAPDKTHQQGSHHKLPRDESQPHSSTSTRRSATSLPQQASSRETTIVRIPIKSAKHHFGAGVSRGSRPYNEDTYQTGTIEIPAFAKRQPLSVKRRSAAAEEEGEAAPSESGDPQVFYFGVFDGHGGSECSEFLRDRLHGYIEEAALLFGMQSSLQSGSLNGTSMDDYDTEGGVMGEQDAEDLQKSLVSSWKETVGGYFKRFRPDYFPAVAKPNGNGRLEQDVASNSFETVLTYSFLKADLDLLLPKRASIRKKNSPSLTQSTIQYYLTGHSTNTTSSIIQIDQHPRISATLATHHHHQTSTLP